MPMSKRAKWKIFSIVVSASSLFRFGAACPPGWNLHHVGGAVAGRKLDDAKPVAFRIEAHRFGVDRNRAAV